MWKSMGLSDSLVGDTGGQKIEKLRFFKDLVFLEINGLTNVDHLVILSFCVERLRNKFFLFSISSCISINYYSKAFCSAYSSFFYWSWANLSFSCF